MLLTNSRAQGIVGNLLRLQCALSDQQRLVTSMSHVQPAVPQTRGVRRKICGSVRNIGGREEPSLPQRYNSGFTTG
jgi:hypothetical protein